MGSLFRSPSTPKVPAPEPAPPATPASSALTDQQMNDAALERRRKNALRIGRDDLIVNPGTSGTTGLRIGV
jgi:hypothetical protein